MSFNTCSIWLQKVEKVIRNSGEHTLRVTKSYQYGFNHEIYFARKFFFFSSKKR